MNEKGVFNEFWMYNDLYIYIEWCRRQFSGNETRCFFLKMDKVIKKELVSDFDSIYI